MPLESESEAVDALNVVRCRERKISPRDSWLGLEAVRCQPAKRISISDSRNMFGLHFLKTRVFSLGVSFDTFW